jgi:FdhD protein
VAGSPLVDLHVRSAVTVVRDGRPSTVEDDLAIEEPLEIRVDGEPFSVTMRTPGHDLELAAGFLVSEGIVAARRELAAIEAVGDEGNVIAATIDGPGAVLARQRRRALYVSSSCGICGTASIEAVTTLSAFGVAAPASRVQGEVLAVLPDRLRAEQRLFRATGGVHAAGLFDASGAAITVREDVGRHNAVDKVVGRAFLDDRLPLADTVLQVSGRASFELVQKARMAGIPVLAAVSAPSSLAVQLAEEAGITLVGFSRGGGFNVYAHPERIDLG